MKIHADGEEKISVTLTKNDMKDFDITYDELDYSNIETRRVIWTILDEVKKVLGKSVNMDNRLLIQVSPEENGGCHLQFTQLQETADYKRKRLIMKKEEQPILFFPFDYDAFTDSFKTLRELLSQTKSTEFYCHNNMPCMIIQPKLSFTEKIVFSLSEFGNTFIPNRKTLNEIYEKGTPYRKESTAFLTSAEPKM